MNIILEEGTELQITTEEMLQKAAAECVRGEGIDPDLVEISLTIVSKEEIHQLNNTYRGVDRVTDVLSFPQYDDLNNIDNEEVVALGDVVICRQVVQEQALEYGHSEQREFVYLFVHSVLHLLGYDHMEEDEKAEMRSREEEVMGIVGLQR